MTHIAPAVYAFWCCLSSCLGAFLVYHLWKFDRFHSLRLTSETRAGAFKRVMTFTYLISVPLIWIYSVGMAVVKYREGYMDVFAFGIIPTPYLLWSPEDSRLILPLAMIFSVAWSLEIVSHLEELCFWLFLTSVGSGKTSWFRSIHFKVWGVGSVLFVIGLPLVTWFTRADPLQCEAYTFLVGSSGSLAITLVSFRVVWAIPNLVGRVRSAGGEPEVIVRLSTFHDLNVKRLIFRVLFVGSMFCLAVDGVTPHRHVNESALWTDLLASAGGVGMVVSSMLTLLIFFPRSIEREAGFMPRRKSTTGRPDEISLQPITVNGVSTTGFGQNTSQQHHHLTSHAGQMGTGSMVRVTKQQESTVDYGYDIDSPESQYGPQYPQANQQYSQHSVDLSRIVTDGTDTNEGPFAASTISPAAAASSGRDRRDRNQRQFSAARSLSQSRSQTRSKPVWEMVTPQSQQPQSSYPSPISPSAGGDYFTSMPDLNRSAGGSSNPLLTNGQLSTSMNTVPTPTGNIMVEGKAVPTVTHKITIPPRRPARPDIHPMLMHYTSPINVLQGSERGTFSYDFV